MLRWVVLRAAWVTCVFVAASATAALAQAAPDHATSRAYNVALGVDCTHCHAGALPPPPTYDFARRMAAMVRGLNEGPLAGRAPLTCWSCHRGRMIPARLPRADWEALAAAYAPVFTAGHADQELAMSVYAASLGVGCAHCHVENAWADRSRPAYATARLMASMFELIPTFFDAAVRAPRTQCYMCHQGRTRVERAPSPGR